MKTFLIDYRRPDGREDFQVYGYGQKDYRSSRSMVCYAKWDGSGFVRCDKLGRELKA